MSTLRKPSPQCFPAKEIEIHHLGTFSFLLMVGLGITLGAQCSFTSQEVEGGDDGLSFAQGAHHGLLAFQHLQLDEGIGLGCTDLDCNALGHCHFNGVPVVRKVRL